MLFGSLFSGIGGFDLGFEQAGMKCAWQVEYDAQARAVLQRHWPDAALHNDVHHIYAPGVHSAGGSRLEPVDLVCGGFPCQDLSVAGKRAGLAGERSGLWFEFHRILTELRPQWVVIENVPGLLSSNRGADFAIVLQGLVQLRYGVSWRVLDAQYFGVAQRRRRVFIVGSLGDGRSAQILFEREGLFGHPPARRTQGQDLAATIGAQPPSRRNGGSNPTPGTMIAGTLAAGAHPGSYNGNDAQRGNLVSFDWQTAGSERTSIVDEPGATRGLSSSKTLAVHGFRMTAFGEYADDGTSSALKQRDYKNATDIVAFAQNTRDEVRQIGGDGQIAGALGDKPGAKQQNYVAYNIQQNDGGQHKRKDRPDGGMYVKETDTALTVGSTDQTVVAASLGAHHERQDLDHDTYIFEPRYARNGRGAPDTIAPPLKAQNGGTGKGDGAPVVVGFQSSQSGVREVDQHATLDGNNGSRRHNGVALASGVRRLTPTECERLQGFPDGWTAGQSDSARYRQLGNAVAVPVARWIGQRIMEVSHAN